MDKKDWQPYGCQSFFYAFVKIRRLGYSEPELGIDIDVVVPGEDIGGGELCLRQPPHLGETRPGTAIEVRHPRGSDDRDIARTLDHHRSAVQPGITYSFALIRRKDITTFEDPTNCHGDCRVGTACITKTKLGIEIDIVVNGERVACAQ